MTAVQKVTAFITQQRRGVPQLLLFQHPTAGIQIPAGTVEAGEDWPTAALREATEETSLTHLTIQGYLGKIDNELAAGEAVLNRDCQVLPIPGRKSWPFEHKFTRGVTVQMGERSGRFCRVTYQEYDRLPNPTAVALHIDGWLPVGYLSQIKTRHYAHLLCHEKTPDRWALRSDNNHIFAPLWVNLRPKPPVVPPQDRWLNDVYEALLAQEWQS